MTPIVAPVITRDMKPALNLCWEDMLEHQKIGPFLVLTNAQGEIFYSPMKLIGDEYNGLEIRAQEAR